jgi:hypothetical protein
MHRRQILAGITAGASLFAGCNALSNGDSDGDDGDTRTATNSQNEQTSTEAVTQPTPETALSETTHPQTATAMASPPPPPSPTPTPTLTETPRAVTTTPAGTASSTAINPNDLTTYTNASYSIKYPTEWVVSENSETPPRISSSNHHLVMRISIYTRIRIASFLHLASTRTPNPTSRSTG